PSLTQIRSESKDGSVRARGTFTARRFRGRTSETEGSDGDGLRALRTGTARPLPRGGGHAHSEPLRTRALLHHRRERALPDPGALHAQAKAAAAAGVLGAVGSARRRLSVAVTIVYIAAKRCVPDLYTFIRAG